MPAGPQLIRAMNEQLVLGLIRRAGTLSRADVARMSGLSKPTVSLALTNLERAGLVRPAGTRTGVPGPAAVLYEVRPSVGNVLALDVGSQFLRGAICDLAGTIRAGATLPVQSATGPQRVAELVRLAEKLYAEADVKRSDITQTVLGSPGVFDPRRNALILAPALPGWEQPTVLSQLRDAFGATLMVENDIDAAALAEQAHGHGRGVESFAFLSVGAGIGMGLVLGGRLHRGARGAAGEIGYLPFGDEPRLTRDARRLGHFEAGASAAGILRAARCRRGTFSRRPPAGTSVQAGSSPTRRC
jgi:predicted NBD/HSP70 family sugar kinase